MGTADRPLDASALRDWAHAVVSDLILHIDEINRLNVFPVADSDTGVNMLFTMRAAVVEADLHANSQADAEDVARNAAHRLGLRCGISGQRRCRVARYVARDPVASGAGDLDRAGDRICRRVINPLHGGRCLRIADRLAAWRHRTGGRPAPATRKPRASPDSLGSAIHPPTRRAHRCSCRPADPAALAYSYRRRPPGTADQRRQSNMRPCRNTVIRRR